MLSGCCWNKETINADECRLLRPGDDELLFNRKRRFLSRCLECPGFLEDLRQMNGDLDGLPGLFSYAIEDLLTQRAEIRALTSQAQSRNREIRFLHEVGQVLQTSVDMDEVISMALTAITSGKGFGLNRAILLLVDKDRQHLRGHIAVGPRSREEAGRIWHEIEEHDYSLKEMGQIFFEKKLPSEKEKFRDLLEILSVPMSRNEHLFISTLNEQKTRLIKNLYQEPGIDHWQTDNLGCGELLMVPLISKNRRIGLLLADNVINGRPITAEDVQSIETFALPVSFAIERASLYERLQEELVKVTAANTQLREQQELIVRMEKMALVGKIASNIAHTIRNPLTIIGGFARSLMKSTPQEDAKRTYIESIIRETRRLEEVLQEVLSYSESLHPTFDWWDINQLITGTFAGLRDDLQMNHVNCRFDLEPNLPKAKLDYKKIAYCLRSLVTNAIEAMTGGGQILVRSVLCNDEIHITLTDTGPGMTAETIQAVTTPFFSTKESGSGLGLSLCVRILDEHGAELGIASEEGQGTTFTIRQKISREEEHDPTTDR
ncbi:GAF domain-containing sensor histidine kinase [Trichloromonas sp.]|uniref:GAF domain-containing sensor histidine kinase n=1 Tax=Trichloromonas sp. TaxID=3069249 RepID=UPI003D813A3D